MRGGGSVFGGGGGVVRVSMQNLEVLTEVMRRTWH